jgi:hypothetical protein
MKYYFKTAIIALLTIFIVSCSDDDNNEDLSGEGNLKLFFDNSVNGDDLLLNTGNYLNSNGETLNISRFSYIVSNFVLTDEMGNEFTYPSNDSYFIISEEDNQLNVELTNVPSGNYTSIKFGVGVPMQRFLAGEEAQQEFWDYAATMNMTWAWIVGYKFINYEGTYTSPVLDGEKNFKVHLGSLGDSQDNYREMTLNFPNSARVRPDVTPDVHVVVDANKILDGQTKIELAPLLNAGGTSQIMVDAERSPIVADNAQEMFMVHHVHSSSTH